MKEALRGGRRIVEIGLRQPKVGIPLICVNGCVRECHRTIHHQTTNMVGVKVGQEHVIDLLRLITSRAQVCEKLAERRTK